MSWRTLRCSIVETQYFVEHINVQFGARDCQYSFGVVGLCCILCAADEITQCGCTSRTLRMWCLLSMFSAYPSIADGTDSTSMSFQSVGPLTYAAHTFCTRHQDLIKAISCTSSLCCARFALTAHRNGSPCEDGPGAVSTLSCNGPKLWPFSLDCKVVSIPYQHHIIRRTRSQNPVTQRYRSRREASLRRHQAEIVTHSLRKELVYVNPDCFRATRVFDTDLERPRMIWYMELETCATKK